MSSDRNMHEIQLFDRVSSCVTLPDFCKKKKKNKVMIFGLWKCLLYMPIIPTIAGNLV